MTSLSGERENGRTGELNDARLATSRPQINPFNCTLLFSYMMNLQEERNQQMDIYEVRICFDCKYCILSIIRYGGMVFLIAFRCIGAHWKLMCL